MTTPNESERQAAEMICEAIRNAARKGAAVQVAVYDASACPEDQEAAAAALIHRVIELLMPPGAVLLQKHQLAEIRSIIGDEE